MNKQFKNLSQDEQEAIELEYHLMNPKDFDELMAQAEGHDPQKENLICESPLREKES